MDKEFDPSKQFLGRTIYNLATTDMQGLDRSSINEQCKRIVFTTKDKRRDVGYADGKLEDEIGEYSCVGGFCNYTFPEFKPFTRSILASDHSTWILSSDCFEAIKDGAWYHVNNLYYFSTNPKLDETFMRSIINEKMPAMNLRHFRLINQD